MEQVPQPDCNRFILAGHEPWHYPDRLYATLDQVEMIETDQYAVLFSGVDAAWFDSPATDGLRQGLPLSRDDYASLFRAMPIYLLEIVLNGITLRAFLRPQDQILTTDTNQAAGTTAPLSDAMLAELERLWFRIDLGGAEDDVPAQLYRNLFAAADDIPVHSIGQAEQDVAARLDKTDPLTGEPDATEAQIKSALSDISGQADIAHIVVYDVGQGAANGLVAPDGTVALYGDFGGGCAANTATFPASQLAQFCFCRDPKPPIVLSHWDHDHWSSAGRDTRAHARTWLAPRQTAKGTKRGFHHASLVTAILGKGQLLLWPAASVSITVGQITIHQCTGASRNSSGLAVTVADPGSPRTEPALLPADAGYADLPSSVPASFALIACPHHGGRSNSPTVPLAPGPAYQRLAYSYGPGNTYGHPRTPIRRKHDKAGWRDPQLRCMAPGHVLNTADRACKGLGHIGFDWNAGGIPAGLPCGTQCQLEIKQT